MKIALVAHEIHQQGGMERCMFYLARWLGSQGHTVHLYTADKHCPLADEGFFWKRIPTAERPLTLRLWRFYQNSKAIIPWQDYDIVHANGGIIPVQNVVTIHFCQPAWKQVLADPMACHAYRGVNQWRLWNRYLSVAYATRLERQAVQTSKQVICVSGLVADEVKRFYQPNQSPQVVYNGVSLEEFQPQPHTEQCQQVRQSLGLSPADFVLLFAGEYGRKGLQTVINSLSQLKQPRLKLCIAGRDPMEAYFRQRVVEAGLTDQVCFLGFRKDLPQLMQVADTFVLPSYYEPFGLVVTEAMATGLPVITTRQVGAGELITHGQEGFLLDSAGDVDMLCQAIRCLYEAPDLAQTMGQQARQTVSEYTWEQMAEGIYQQYQAVVQQPKAGLAR